MSGVAQRGEHGSEMIQTSIETTVALGVGNEEKRPYSFASFAAVASNIGAIEASLRFAQATTPLLAVIGSPGWGKTHMVESVAAYMRRQGLSANRPTSALYYANNPERFDESIPLMLDDVQDAWSNMRTKQQLRRLLEQRVRTGRATMATFSDAVSKSEAQRFLPSGHDWGFQTIGQPSRAERELIVRQIADSEGVALSRPIVNLVSRHLYGNGRSIQGAVHTLKLVRPSWGLRGDVCEACGVLMPYIHGEDGWDPRDVVQDVVAKALETNPVDGVAAEQVCAYMLISELGLSEYDTATFLGVSPTKAYAMSNGVKLQLADSRLAECVRYCHDAVVRTLDGESC